MIEAVYLMNKVPDIYLFTISIEEINPMSIDLNASVKNAIPDIIEQIIDLSQKLHSKLA